MAGKTHKIEYVTFGTATEKQFEEIRGTRVTTTSVIDQYKNSGEMRESSLVDSILLQQELIKVLNGQDFDIDKYTKNSLGGTSYGYLLDDYSNKNFDSFDSNKLTQEFNISELVYIIAFLSTQTKSLSAAYNLFKQDYSGYKKMSEMNSTEFNGLFGGGGVGKIWEKLNSNPYLFFEKLTQKEKNDISEYFLYFQILLKHINKSDTFPTLEEIYNFITEDNKIRISSFVAWKGNNLIRPYIIDIESGTQADTVGFSHGIEEDFSGGTITSRGKFYYNAEKNVINSIDAFLVLMINPKLFLSYEQVDVSIGNSTIIEPGAKPKNIVAKDVKEIAELAKKDKLFNIFGDSFLDQNRSSTIYKYIKDIIPEDEGEPTSLRAKKNASAAVGLLALGATGIEALFDNDEKQDFNDKLSQCIILTALKDFAQYSVDLRAEEQAARWGSKEWHYPYGGRIYCVDTEKPNTLINILSSPNGLHRYIKTSNSQDFSEKENIRFNFSLHKIVEKDGFSKEYPFLFEDTLDDTGAKPLFKELLLKNYNPSGSFEQRAAIEKKTFGQTINRNRTGMNNKVQIVDMSIGIKGETVATVRSNIDVTINFSMPSLDIIMAKFEANSRYKDDNGEAETYEFSFSELLSHNVGAGTGFDGTNASRVLNTSYLPKKNRLVMKIFPEIKKPDALSKNLNSSERAKLERYIENSTMVLDLLLVNYDAKRTKTTEDDTISITFKGFTKSFLNEPFCDVITTPELRQTLLEKENAVVKELEEDDKYCDIKEVRKKIQEHYKDMKTTRDDNTEQGLGKNKILEKLVARNRLFKVKLSEGIVNSLNDNVTKDTNKIIDPGKLAGLMKTNGTSIRIESAKDFDQTGEESITAAKNITFFYFGDLVDVLMDVIYGDPKYTTDKKYRQRDQLRDSSTGNVVPEVSGSPVSEIRNKFANFPLKVIMPTFHPIVLEEGEGGKQSFVTSTEDKISVADVPISVAYFQHWYEEEVSKRKTKMYPLGSMIGRMLNSLVNNVISDSCYTIGNIEKKYFSIKTDFGAPLGRSGQFDENRYNKNLTTFDFLWNRQPSKHGNFVKLNNTMAPVLPKLKDVERNKHINYLVIFEQFNAFQDMAALNPERKNNSKRTDLDNNDIPQFKQNYNDTDSGKTSDFVQSMTFSKTDLPFGEEVRFYNDGLNELSTISAVHDCELETLPLITMYPGMLSWIDPSFVDGSEIYGSIPWTMGIGGFHITYEVNHKAEVESSKLTKFKTSIKTKFVDTGSRGAEQAYIKECKDRVPEQSPPRNSDGTVQ